MIRFECDYAEGAHPNILQKITETNLEQTIGYGLDPYCEKARVLIRQYCQAPDADVHFLVGGTQTNTTVIASILRPHQGVLCAESGHINTHESGAIEATGHKVISLPGHAGKLTAEQVEDTCRRHWEDVNHEHTVQPGMVYISYPTEYGTLYTRQELSELSLACRKYRLPLYLDGARLGYGLMAQGTDIKISDLAGFCDCFYIGGTKVGALFGEALVISNPALKKDFRYFIKQHGGLLAKGRLLGLQFTALFEDNLYFDISAHANRLAMKLKDAFLTCGISFLIESSTNQQFPILPNDMQKYLSRKYAFSFWEKVEDTHSAVRFCTSWATKETHIDQLISDLVTY